MLSELSDRQAVWDQVLAGVAELKPDIEDLAAQSALASEGVIDSFDVILIVGQFEDVFGVRIPGSEIVPEAFDSIDAMVDLVLRNHGVA